MKNADSTFNDEDEWHQPWVRGGGIVHLRLRRSADLLVIASLSAKSMTKMMTGLAGNLLLSCEHGILQGRSGVEITRKRFL